MCALISIKVDVICILLCGNKLDLTWTAIWRWKTRIMKIPQMVSFSTSEFLSNRNLKQNPCASWRCPVSHRLWQYLFSYNNWPSYDNFQIWPTFWPGDVIDDVMSMWNIICTTRHPTFSAAKYCFTIWANRGPQAFHPWSSMSGTILFWGLPAIILAMLPLKNWDYSFRPFFKMASTKSEISNISEITSCRIMIWGS